MKKQFLLTLMFVMISCFSTSIVAQVAPKKKAATATVKKATVGINKKKSNGATSNEKIAAPKKNTPVLIETNSFGRYKCKVTKTNFGCTITFNAIIDPNSDLAKKEDLTIKKEFNVNYSDNSITDLSADVPLEKKNKVKSEAAIMVEEQLGGNSNENQSTVQIKGLNFSFDLAKGSKDTPSINNEYLLPGQLADGSYAMNINWTWDMPIDKVKNTQCSLIFKIVVRGGMIVSITN
jgi:hypothetical protein